MIRQLSLSAGGQNTTFQPLLGEPEVGGELLGPLFNLIDAGAVKREKALRKQRLCQFSRAASDR